MEDWIQNYLAILKNKMISMYGVTEEDAAAAIDGCGMAELCDEIPEYVDHYPVSYWAKKIKEIYL